MKKSIVIEKIENLHVDYKDKLKNFIEKYCKTIEDIKFRAMNEKDDSDFTKSFQRFENWIENYTDEDLDQVIGCLKDDKTENVAGFIDYYDFLLECSANDNYNLIDLLFTIPRQFVKEFAIQKEPLKNRRMDLDDFINYAKERFGCDICVEPCNQADPFVQIFGVSFLEKGGM